MPKREADSLLRVHRLYSMEPKQFIPLRGKVLVKLEPRNKEGELVLVEKEHREVQQNAEVISVGPQVHEIQPGQRVVCIHDVLSDHVYKFHNDPESYYEVLPQEQILGVVEP